LSAPRHERGSNVLDNDKSLYYDKTYNVYRGGYRGGRTRRAPPS
jgi:hypothetical protein